MIRKTVKSVSEKFFSNNSSEVEIPIEDCNSPSNDFKTSLQDSKLTFYDRQQSISSNKDFDYTQTPLYKAFSPLMMSLKLVGLHHTRRKNNGGKYFALPTVSQVYSWFLTIVAWMMIVRVAATLRFLNSPGPAMLSTLSSLTWMTLCALNATCFLKASYNPESIVEYFGGFIKLNKFGGPYVCPKKIQKYILAGTIVTWIIVIITATVFGYMVNATQLFDILATDPLTLDSDTYLYWAMKIIFTIIGFFLSAFWVFPSAMQLSVCLIIHRELKLFRTSLGSNINDDGVFICQSLEPERRRFLQIVKIIESADSCLSLHQSSAFACNITNTCLLLYIILYYPEFNSLPSAVGAMAFWLFYAFADICVVIASGVSINSEVSE